MLKPNEVLVESHDHGYRIAHVVERNYECSPKSETIGQEI